MAILGGTPRWLNDCDICIYLGQDEVYDVYLHYKNWIAKHDHNSDHLVGDETLDTATQPYADTIRAIKALLPRVED